MKTMRSITTIMVTVWKTEDLTPAFEAGVSLDKDGSIFSGLRVHRHHEETSAVFIGWKTR
jgi:hypothetical protein